MKQQIGHALCSCGHVKGTHADGKGLCQLKGCTCRRFELDGYVSTERQPEVIPLFVGGSWI